MKQIIENLRRLKDELFISSKQVQNLIDETLKLAEEKNKLEPLVSNRNADIEKQEELEKVMK